MRKSNIQKVKINRLFNGCASVRSSLIDSAKQNNISLLLECKNETMLLQPKDLDKGRITINKYFISKWDNKPYTLIDFEWKCTNQLKLL